MKRTPFCKFHTVSSLRASLSLSPASLQNCRFQVSQQQQQFQSHAGGVRQIHCHPRSRVPSYNRGEVASGSCNKITTSLSPTRALRWYPFQHHHHQGTKRHFSQLVLGDTVPNFVQDSTLGSIHYHEYAAGYWSIIMAHPKQEKFSAVSDSEIAAFASNYQKEFVSGRAAKIIALQIETLDRQNERVKDIENEYNVKVTYPLVADEDASVANMLSLTDIRKDDPGDLSRCLLIVDPQMILRARLMYPVDVAHSTEEILRVLDALKVSKGRRAMTPADWKAGEEIIVPNDDESPGKFKRVQVE